MSDNEAGNRSGGNTKKTVLIVIVIVAVVAIVGTLIAAYVMSSKDNTGSALKGDGSSSSNSKEIESGPSGRGDSSLLGQDPEGETGVRSSRRRINNDLRETNEQQASRNSLISPQVAKATA